MKKVVDIFLTIYLWGVTGFSFIITFLICLIFYPFISEKTFSRLYENIIGTIIIYSMLVPDFWKYKVIDRRKDKNWDNRYIVVANHLSLVDSLIISISIPISKKYMIGQAFTKIPVFGWFTKMSGYIPVDKNDKTTTVGAVDKVLKTIEDGSSFVIFPEGKRELIPYKFEEFKSGCFRIALATGIPILPVTLLGTAEAMPIGGLVSQSDITVIIDEPFLVEDEDYKKYIEKTKNIIKENLD